MASFNKVILMGNLTRDPELRQFPSGGYVCKLGLAVNRRFKTAQGEERDEVTFVDVEAFNKQAEVLAKFMTKGRPLLVEGRLKLDQWQDSEGNNRSRLGVVLESFTFIGGRGDGQNEGGQDDGGSTGSFESAGPAPRQTRSTTPAPETDDDVPF